MEHEEEKTELSARGKPLKERIQRQGINEEKRQHNQEPKHTEKTPATQIFLKKISGEA